MSDIDLVFLIIFLVLGCITALITIMLRNLMVRYDQFRQETAFVLADLQAQMIDVNRRLSEAGYPPGRVTPVPGNMPDWYRKGTLPDGTPLPRELRRWPDEWTSPNV